MLHFYINITFYIYILMQKTTLNVPKNQLHFLHEKLFSFMVNWDIVMFWWDSPP